MQVLINFFSTQMNLLKSSPGCISHFGDHFAMQQSYSLLPEHLTITGISKPKSMEDKNKPTQATKKVILHFKNFLKL